MNICSAIGPATGSCIYLSDTKILASLFMDAVLPYFISLVDKEDFG